MDEKLSRQFHEWWNQVYDTLFGLGAESLDLSTYDSQFNRLVQEVECSEHSEQRG